MNANHRRTKSELLQTARECAIKTLTIVVTSFHTGRRYLSQNSSELSRLAWRRFLLAPRRLPWPLLMVALLLSLKAGCVPRATLENLNERQQNQQSSGSLADDGADGNVESGRQASCELVSRPVHTTEKPTIEATDPLTNLIIVREQLDEAVEQFVHNLTDRLPPREAAYVSAIYRTHSAGQCLIELHDWSRNPRSVQLLKPEDRQALLELLQRWREWELELARQGTTQ